MLYEIIFKSFNFYLIKSIYLFFFFRFIKSNDDYIAWFYYSLIDEKDNVDVINQISEDRF